MMALLGETNRTTHASAATTWTLRPDKHESMSQKGNASGGKQAKHHSQHARWDRAGKVGVSRPAACRKSCGAPTERPLKFKAFRRSHNKSKLYLAVQQSWYRPRFEKTCGGIKSSILAARCKVLIRPCCSNVVHHSSVLTKQEPSRLSSGSSPVVTSPRSSRS